MKYVVFILTFWVLLFSGIVLFARPNVQRKYPGKYITDTVREAGITRKDSLAQALPADAFKDGEDVGSPIFLLLLLAIFAKVVLPFFALVIIAIILFLFGIFALVSGGILSTSIIIGINTRSYASGFKTFIVLSSAFGLAFICAIAGTVINLYNDWHHGGIAFMLGMAGGFFTGAALGFLACYCIRRLTGFLRRKLVRH